MKLSNHGFSPRRGSRTTYVGMQTTKTHTLSDSPIWKVLGFLLVGICLSQAGIAQNRGINFPPTQGSSGAGAFQPGIYKYSYTNAQIAAANATFNTMRLPINVQTANDPASLAKLKGYVEQFAGHYAIICMFGTLQPGQTGHGNGLPNGLSAMGAAWAKINAVFANYPNVHYEIFNEPFGYNKSDPAHYVRDMETIIKDAGLPYSKCILDGMGYADDINLVAAGGWSGDLAYHFYPTWLPAGQTTQSNYSNKAQADLRSWGQKTWVTEFGADLSKNNPCYDTSVDGSYSNVNTLRGLDDALRALKATGHGVLGAFSWHGWNNGDTYDYWSSSNSNGVCKVREIETND